ncbi:ribonuclease H-like [Mantella aurantiaca]
MSDPKLILFTDGCCYKGPEGNVASYAEVQQTKKGLITVDSGIIPQPASAQKAEIVALSQALKIAAGYTANIYTDSAYAHGVIHVDGPQWIRRGFLTSAKTPVKHEELLKELLHNVHLPTAVAVIKCKGHQKNETDEAKGNEAADRAATKAGGYQLQLMM